MKNIAVSYSFYRNPNEKINIDENFPLISSLIEENKGEIFHDINGSKKKRDYISEFYLPKTDLRAMVIEMYPENFTSEPGGKGTIPRAFPDLKGDFSDSLVIFLDSTLAFKIKELVA